MANYDGEVHGLAVKTFWSYQNRLLDATRPRKERMIMVWPHAPNNWLFNPGLYFVSAGTYHKAHLLNSPERLSLVRERLFQVAQSHDWQL